MRGKEGKIYILRSPYLKDAVIKIGRTSRISEQRAKEISSSTGVPFEYEVLYEEDVYDSHLAEKLIHEILDKERINKRREFFQVPLKTAVKVVFQTCLKVNSQLSEEASSRLLIIVTGGFDNPNLVKQLAEVLSPNKGGGVSVWLLYVRKDAEALIKIGEEWDVSLSPEMINELKQLRGITSVQWTSKDLGWLEEIKIKEFDFDKFDGSNDDEIPF